MGRRKAVGYETSVDDMRRSVAVKEMRRKRRIAAIKELALDIAGGMLGGAIGFVLLAAIFGAWWA